EENNNLLVLQNSQAITQLSQVLKNNTPVVEKEDLNLYVSSSELKEEAPKPLNPTVLTERDDGLETAEGVETGGALMAELGSAPTPNSGIMAIVDAQTAEPKENTMSENIAQSHLKFVQSDKQGIPENRSYSKLLNAMNQKPKNQPPVVGTLRTTFAHPDRYSESYEVPKPKPKKYTLAKDDSIRSSVISSTESSSNIKSNAIMGEAIENDIINLAKDISQERKTPDTEKVDAPHKPIIYNKQPIQREDPFESINENKLNEKEKTKNSNIIDLS
ncbi:MAG TPA: hypothetical protein PLX10_01470, partial [Candidatus Paceibacterota bacterium]|nr:hypothetical protein [Candidatus Paceibacterota bacterium]